MYTTFGFNSLIEQLENLFDNTNNLYNSKKETKDSYSDSDKYEFSEEIEEDIQEVTDENAVVAHMTSMLWELLKLTTMAILTLVRM
ncbi:hypothetical protein [Myxosarcina sp. GI1]|uniref:hypothetical protein n=1 Tax=Myxosarcina sp. GI1 TaxID=1541065 RepID=UPI00055B5B8F|nr:hypothetical protein [Myxosarcina sp. GI1]